MPQEGEPEQPGAEQHVVELEFAARSSGALVPVNLGEVRGEAAAPELERLDVDQDAVGREQRSEGVRGPQGQIFEIECDGESLGRADQAQAECEEPGCAELGTSAT